MARLSELNRLSVKLTAAFLIVAIMGVTLVAILAYRSASSEFGTFLRHVEGMERMMGGDMMGGMMGGVGGLTTAQAERDFLGNLGRILWIAGISGVVLAIILGALFTHWIVAPLEKVAAAARRAARGDLSQRVDRHGSDEVGELADSFNTMTAALERDRELRHNMVADIAHELRTPLAVLRGNVEAIQDGVLPPDDKNLFSLHEEILLLSRLVEDLHILSLAEGGHLELQPQATDMEALARQALAGFETEAVSRGITVSLEVNDGIRLARVDPLRTSQVLRNLLSNALRYTPGGGSVTLRLTSEKGGAVVSVADTGSGIHAEELPRVFERFYRVDRSRSRSSGGSGLGLAIVKQLVESQGGRVWVESAVGQGSTFSFWVPYASS